MGCLLYTSDVYKRQTFNTFIYNEYQRTENGIELSSSLPVLSTYAKPTNNLNIETKAHLLIDRRAGENVAGALHQMYPPPGHRGRM